MRSLNSVSEETALPWPENPAETNDARFVAQSVAAAMQQECGKPSSRGAIVHKSWECRDRATKLPHDAQTKVGERGGFNGLEWIGFAWNDLPVLPDR